MKSYSCFTFSYSKRYYLTHPWYWFRDLGRNIRDSYHRIKYGFCYSDIWNWCDWFMNTTPKMFRYLAEHGSAYPSREPFDTPEKWHDWLLETADLIETGREDWQEEHNKYYEEFMKHLMDGWKSWKDENGMIHSLPQRERTELDEKYYNTAKHLAVQGDKNIRIALENIGKFFYLIWD